MSASIEKWRLQPDDRNIVKELITERGYVMIYEEYTRGLPEEFTSTEGLSVIRTGPIPRWIVNHPEGIDRRIQLAGVFAYDPARGEAIIVRIKQSDSEYGIKRSKMLDEGWTLIPSATDRIVAHRPFSKSQQS